MCRCGCDMHKEAEAVIYKWYPHLTRASAQTTRLAPAAPVRLARPDDRRHARHWTAGPAHRLRADSWTGPARRSDGRVRAACRADRPPPHSRRVSALHARPPALHARPGADATSSTAPRGSRGVTTLRRVRAPARPQGRRRLLSAVSGDKLLKCSKRTVHLRYEVETTTAASCQCHKCSSTDMGDEDPKPHCSGF